MHSGCCEAVLECAPHAVDSRIFGSKNHSLKKIKKVETLCIIFFVSLIFVQTVFAKTEHIGHPVAAASGVHSSAVERRIADPEVAGSIPVAPCSRLAQLVERKTLNLVVVGSSPTVGVSTEPMAQWQRVGFQTRRLGVRIPLGSWSFFCFYTLCIRTSQKPHCRRVRAWSSLVMTPASHAGNPEFESRRA